MSVPIASAAEIAAAIAELDELDDVARAAAARRLARSVPGQLARLADAATYAATREATQSTVAARLGVNKNQIEKIVTRHLAWLRDQR